MRISICQTNSGPDKSANLELALALLDQAAAEGAELAALPEAVNYIGPRERVYEVAEDLDGPFNRAIGAKAREKKMWVVGGTTRVKLAAGRVTNTLAVFDPSGEMLISYDKLHMFDVAIPGQVETRESSSVRPGSHVKVTEIAGVKSGLSVCYDLRFPELFRLQALAGAKLLFLPSAFTTFTGRDHWEVLLRARAIENQCFVIAPNQSGSAMPGIPLYGNSMIVDPWGTVIAQVTEDVGVATADVDLEKVSEVRERLPSLMNRRADIYDLIDLTVE